MFIYNRGVGYNYTPHVSVDFESMAQARLQLHHAAQVVRALSQAFLESVDDDSHTNMGWEHSSFSLTGRELAAANHTFSIAVRVDEPSVSFRHHGTGESDSFVLHGRTLRQLHTWLVEHIAASGLDASSLDFGIPYDLPEHAVRSSAAAFAFAGLEPATIELANWFANSFVVLDELARRTAADPTRLWPHHFDVGGFVAWSDNGVERSMGFGMSPGDEHYPHPYYYVTPSPTPARAPALPPGARWRTKGFVGAVLDAEGLLQAEHQERLLRAFLAAASMTHS